MEGCEEEGRQSLPGDQEHPDTKLEVVNVVVATHTALPIPRY